MISIVLPVYNGEEFLQEAIASCLTQTYKDIELIIVDDGSVDRTADIVKSFSDKRIKYIKNNVNIGLPESLNVGFAQARGALLTWTSCDNAYYPNALEKMFAATKAGAEFIYADYIILDERTKAKHIRKTPTLYNPSDKEDTGSTIGPCFLFTARVKEAVGAYRKEVVYAEDYDFILRAYRTGAKFERIPEVLYKYRWHDDTLTTKYMKNYHAHASWMFTRLENGFMTAKECTEFCAAKKPGTQKDVSDLLGLFSEVANGFADHTAAREYVGLYLEGKWSEKLAPKKAVVQVVRPRVKDSVVRQRQSLKRR
jgi:glycosyltransferase involved in cell wall biosynthesis